MAFGSGEGAGKAETCRRGGIYLEDHPKTCKWLITMISKSLSRIVPLPNGLFMAYKSGLLTTY